MSKEIAFTYVQIVPLISIFISWKTLNLELDSKQRYKSIPHGHDMNIEYNICNEMYLAVDNTSFVFGCILA